MPGVALLDRYHPQIAAVIVNADHVLNAGGFELVPEHAGAQAQIHGISARPKRRFVLDDRLVSMIDRFDPHHRLRLAGAERTAGIVTRPFAEGAFVARLFALRRALPSLRNTP